MTRRLLRIALWSDAFAAVILASGIASAISCWWLRGSLWEDEIIAVTHGLQPFPLFFVEIVRNDIHPFVYFLLLKFWSFFDAGSDSWLLASSLAGALCSTAAVAYVAFRVNGGRAALWAAALFCALPTFSWSASNLRMYAIMPAIAIGCWYANRETLRVGGIGWLLATVFLQLVQSYTHAIGFFFAAFIALSALIGQRDSTTRSRFLRWMGAQSVSLLTMLPVVVSALVRGTEPLPTPTPWSLLTYPAQTASVWGAVSWPLAAGGFAFAVMVALALLEKESRILVLVVPCGALLACILASSMGKPMYKAPVFSANLTPFLALGASIGVTGIGTRQYRLTRFVGVIAGIVMATGLWTGELSRNITGNYEPAARYIAAKAKPGDLIILPSQSTFWGILRYAVGPRWGEPLAIMPLQSNPQWAALQEKLGPGLVTRLGLRPTADHIESHGVRYVIGKNVQDVETCQRIWVVHRNNYLARGQETVAFPRSLHQDMVRSFGDDLTVALLKPDDCFQSPDTWR